MLLTRATARTDYKCLLNQRQRTYNVPCRRRDGIVRACTRRRARSARRRHPGMPRTRRVGSKPGRAGRTPSIRPEIEGLLQPVVMVVGLQRNLLACTMQLDIANAARKNPFAVDVACAERCKRNESSQRIGISFQSVTLETMSTYASRQHSWLWCFCSC
jgi:hypothetical protein